MAKNSVLPSTMSSETHNAIVTTSPGVVKLVQLPTPNPTEDEVLIRVEYSSVIAFDTYTVDKGYAVPTYPVPLGFNAAGTVAKLGSNVNGLQVGDRASSF